MSALLARLIDDAALFAPRRAPMDEALSVHRADADAPAGPGGAGRLVGRFLCPASRFTELRTHLVPEDFLDLGVIADTGIEELPKAMDAVHAEPRVRPSSVEIALPRDADQARAAAVTIARLPSDVPARIEVRHAAGWLHALDRIAAARGGGAGLGAKFRVGGAPGGDAPTGMNAAAGPAAFISACAARELPFTCAGRPGASPHGPMNVLLATAHAAAGGSERDVRDTLGRTDAEGLARELLALPEDGARAARRLLAGFGVPDVRRCRLDLAAAGLIRTPDGGEDMSP
ncbi:hypothetical protein ACN3XK_09180 [Actinomadura welshii]